MQFFRGSFLKGSSYLCCLRVFSLSAAESQAGGDFSVGLLLSGRARTCQGGGLLGAILGAIFLPLPAIVCLPPACRKWVGTTEAATVLRYFGLNACIIDFGTPPDEMAQVQALAAAAAAANGSSSSGSAGGTVEIHVNVECDGCGCAPIVGPRYRSQVLSNYDLCGRCYQAQGGDSSPSGPFQRMLATRGEAQRLALGLSLWGSGFVIFLVSGFVTNAFVRHQPPQF